MYSGKPPLKRAQSLGEIDSIDKLLKDIDNVQAKSSLERIVEHIEQRHVSQTNLNIF